MTKKWPSQHHDSSAPWLSWGSQCVAPIFLKYPACLRPPAGHCVPRRRPAETRWFARRNSMLRIDIGYSTRWFGPIKEVWVSLSVYVNSDQFLSVYVNTKSLKLWNCLPPRMWSRNDSNGVYFELSFPPNYNSDLQLESPLLGGGTMGMMGTIHPRDILITGSE